MATNGKKRKKQKAVIHCFGGSALKEGIELASLPETCAERKEAFQDGVRECKYGCLGGGDCVNACKLKAIAITENEVASIDRDRCVGCGLCVKKCPQEIISLIPQENVIIPKCSNEDKGAVARQLCDNSCIACSICEKTCPAGAIHVVDFHAVIDHSLCISCGMCAVKCPRAIICDANGIITVKR